jgi:archaeosine-15-forming tRNA-guanine transglycosylase
MAMNEYKKRVLSVVVLPEGEPVFSQYATTVAIDDEAGGEFVVVSQDGAMREAGSIAIDAQEWPALRDAIDLMIAECRK